MNPLQDVFISYGRADSYQFAKQLNERLLTEGLNVWFDFDDIPLGVDYQKQIDDGIDKADNFLFIISPHSVNSPYCGLEIKRALERGKRIIPILQVEEISRDTWQQRNPKGTDEQWADYQATGKHSSYPNMHSIIKKINWVYCRETDDFEQAIAGLLAIFQHHLDYVRYHTVLLNQSLTWQQNKKQRKFLLAGESLQQAQDWLQLKFKDTQPPCYLTDLHCEYVTESRKNAQNGKTQVFLGYMKQDTTTMIEVRRFLRRHGITVWSAQTDIAVGDDANVATDIGIENADNIIPLLSPEFLASKDGKHQLVYAASLNKRIIPIIIQPIDLEPLTEQIRSTLQSLRCIDISATEQPWMDRLESSIALRQIWDDAAYVAVHKTLLVKALAWERQVKNPCVLLQGYALNQAEAWLKTAEIRQTQKPIQQQREFIQASIDAPPITTFDVFLSYSREDSDTAHKLNNALQQQGKHSWFDQENIPEGADFQQEIRRGIEASDNFVFILSPASIKSPYCQEEVDYAVSLNKRCVTILCREIDPSQLHSELAKIQWIDFTQNDADFSANFNQLVRTLDTDRDHVQSHTKWSQRALEWNQKEHSDDLLLRGVELAIAESWQQQCLQENKQPSLTALQSELITASRQQADAEAAKAQQRVTIMRRQLKATILASIAAIVGLGVFGMTGWWTFIQSKKNVEDIVMEWNEEINNYVNNSIKSNFKKIASSSESVAKESRNGNLDVSNNDQNSEIRKFLWEQFNLVDDQITNIYFGGEDGKFTGISITDQKIYLNVVTDLSILTRRKYKIKDLDEVQNAEELERLLLNEKQYDPRERPWYKTAIAQEGLNQTVSSVYRTFESSPSDGSNSVENDSNKEETNQKGEMDKRVLSLSRAVLDSSGEIQGVAGADLYLYHLENLLENAGGEATKLFIVELSGNLVAAYPKTQIIRGKETRIKARESSEDFISETAQFLWDDSSDENPNELSCAHDQISDEKGNKELLINEKKYFFQVSHVGKRTDLNLDWCMVTLISEDDVMKEIKRSYKFTRAVLIGSIILTSILGIYVYRAIRLSADFE